VCLPSAGISQRRGALLAMPARAYAVTAFVALPWVTSRSLRGSWGDSAHVAFGLQHCDGHEIPFGVTIRPKNKIKKKVERSLKK